MYNEMGSSDNDKLATMSDNSDGSDNLTNGKADDICRDFLRNVCKRGKRCRYRHPDSDGRGEVGKKDFTFCHDFQNTGCRRPNCKFLHCTREEEEYYKQTGQLPPRLTQAVALGIGVQNTDPPLQKGEVPICKDYLKGECHRGTRCKFRHLTSSEYELELRRIERRNRYLSSRFDALDALDRYDTDTLLGLKRRRLEYDVIGRTRLDPYDDFDSQDIYSASRPISDYKLLEEENALLRRKLEEYKKQCSDLAATNEVLLEQNARFRSAKVNSLNVHQAVTSLSTSTPSVVTVCSAPPAPLVESVTAPCLMAQGLTQPTFTNLALNTEITSQQVIQRQLQQVELASQASLPPAQTIQNPPVTINPPSIVPPVSMTPSVIAASLAQCSVPHSSIPQCSVPQSIPHVAAMSMSGPTNAMVSYPTLSQNHHQRPALQ